MTDDRARRLRDIRNRRATDEDESEDAPAESDESEDASSDEAEPDAESPASGDESEEADTTGENASASEKGPNDADAEEFAESEQESTDTEDATETAAESEPESDSNGDDAAGAGSEDGTEADVDVEVEADGTVDEDATDDPTAEDDGTESGEPTTGTVFGGATEATLEGAIAGMSDTVTIDERVGEATVDATAIQGSDTYGDAGGRDGESVFERGDSLVASTARDDVVQMLEFFLNENRYAIEIDRISAIVEMKEITRFPRGPDAIDGVTDLRGEITGVLDPTTMLDIEHNEPSDDQYIVVLERDGDKQKLGVRVTDVSQAVTYRKSQIDETGTVMDGGTGDHEFVEGIIKKEIETGTALVAWLDVDGLIENAEMDYAPGDYRRE